MVTATEITTGEWRKRLPDGEHETLGWGWWAGTGGARIKEQIGPKSLCEVTTESLEAMFDRGVEPGLDGALGKPCEPGEVVGWDLDFVGGAGVYGASCPGFTKREVAQVVERYVPIVAEDMIERAEEKVGLEVAGVHLCGPWPRPKGRLHTHILVWAKARALGSDEPVNITPAGMDRFVDEVQPFDGYLWDAVACGLDDEVS